MIDGGDQKLERIELLGTQLSLYDKSCLLELIQKAILDGESLTIFSGNVLAYNLAYENSWLRDVLNQADAVRLDGAGVRLGARILGYQTPERTTWADFGWELAEFADLHGFSIFFLGGKPGVPELAAARLLDRFSDLRIAGTHHGFFNKTHGSEENEAVIAKINEVKPNILVIAFGMPLQERWLVENWDRIEANVALTGGAVFDYLSGELKRAPRWMTDHGLEWLGRLLIEPGRLWRRYLIGNPLFILRVLGQKFGFLNLDNSSGHQIPVKKKDAD